MAITLSTALRPVFRLSADSFPKLAAARFGAQEDMDRTWHTFEPVARTLVDSFYLAVDDCRHETLVPLLNAVDPELRGIAYEGAGMGLMLLDSLLPTRKRLPAFIHGPGAPYRCLIYIGAGLVLPRVPVSTQRFLARQDPMYRWFVMDGYGFYRAFFAWRNTIERQRVPGELAGYARRAFDQGVGRSLWFSTGANVERIISTIAGFKPDRRGDLWSGIGVACAYAAGVMDRAAIETLLAAAGPHHRADLAVGAGIASIFREQSGLDAPHTDLACQVIWGRSASAVAELVQVVGLGSREASGTEPYETWRKRVRSEYLVELADAWPGRAS